MPSHLMEEGLSSSGNSSTPPQTARLLLRRFNDWVTLEDVQHLCQQYDGFRSAELLDPHLPLWNADNGVIAEFETTTAADHLAVRTHLFHTFPPPLDWSPAACQAPCYMAVRYHNDSHSISAYGHDLASDAQQEGPVKLLLLPLSKELTADDVHSVLACYSSDTNIGSVVVEEPTAVSNTVDDNGSEGAVRRAVVWMRLAVDAIAMMASFGSADWTAMNGEEPLQIYYARSSPFIPPGAFNVMPD